MVAVTDVPISVCKPNTQYRLQFITLPESIFYQPRFGDQLAHHGIVGDQRHWDNSLGLEYELLFSVHFREKNGKNLVHRRSLNKLLWTVGV